MFRRGTEQFDRLRKRNAFLDQYRRHEIFADNLEMFNETRSAVGSIMDEYALIENPEYLQTLKPVSG